MGIGAIWSFPRLKKEPLYWFCLATFGLHLFLISRATRWWGGAAFGPRLLAEIIPVLYLLMIFIWREFKAAESRRVQRLAMAGFILLSLFGLLFNSIQGLFNSYTLWWNGALSPDIDRQSDTLLDWNHPQFLASNLSTCDREQLYIGHNLDDDGLGLGMRVYKSSASIPFVTEGQVGIHDLEGWAADLTAGTANLDALNLTNPIYADQLGRPQTAELFSLADQRRLGISLESITILEE